jgi:hypothetical protein
MPPELRLCDSHGKRYVKDWRIHFMPVITKLSKKWLVRRGIAQGRTEDVLRALSDEMHTASWQATWVQMVDLELLNQGHGGQRGRWETVDGAEVWVPEGEPKPRPSYPGYPRKAPERLPEAAYPEGQRAIAKRVAEQQLLEQRLAAETEAFQRGQRQVLELELKTKRATEAMRKAKEKK